MMAEEGVFQLVTHKKKGKSRYKAPPQNRSETDQNTKATENEDVSSTKLRIDKNISDFKLSGYCDKVVDMIRGRFHRDVDKIVAYGVGNFGSDPIAMCQFSLLILIARALEVTTAMEFYDPRLTACEYELCGRYGVDVIGVNEEGRRTTDGQRRCLFYMLHCGRPLYNNLLWANWDPVLMTKMAIVGNSFKGVMERTPVRTLQSETWFLKTVLDFVDEFALPEFSSQNDAFNDTAIHVFNGDRVKSAPVDIWTRGQGHDGPPVYTEYLSEIITDS